MLQRVSRAQVRVEEQEVASIGRGLVLLVGIEPEDTMDDVRVAVEKVAGLRVFPDGAGKMNLSIGEAGGGIIVVSQFTLLGDVRRGRRPSFTGAAAPDVAAPLVEAMVDGFRQLEIETGAGVFGAMMDVDLVNDGPVTLVFSVRSSKLG